MGQLGRTSVNGDFKLTGKSFFQRSDVESRKVSYLPTGYALPDSADEAGALENFGSQWLGRGIVAGEQVQSLTGMPGGDPRDQV